MKQHPLLGNRFLIRKYMQPLVSNDFADKHVPTEMMGATTEELFFFCWPCRGVINGTSLVFSSVMRVVGYSPDSNEVSPEAEESSLLEAVTRE
jgi:hypothetical protein